jgi:mannosyl-3-phosphoglycerate phosphatase
LRDELRIPLRGFHELDGEELAAIAGMNLNDARLALVRDFDEPFWLTGDANRIDELRAAALSRGLQVSRGGRFLHLHGDNDKGKAVGIVLDILTRKQQRRLISAGIGDSPNDIPMLQRVDKPYLVQKPDKSHDPAVLAEVPGIIAIAGVGPKGWKIAVAEFIDDPALK